MKADYKRDVNHNYLVLSEGAVDVDSYPIRMLSSNVVPSLLKCRIQSMDGEILFYYDITSRQSVTTIFETYKLKQRDLQMILDGFLQIMEQMGEYLLNPSQLLLDPAYMFVEMEMKKVYFCYLPGYKNDVREKFRQLTEYLLPKLDHEDAMAVMIGYGVYRKALEDTFRLEDIKEELFRKRAEDLPGRKNGQREEWPSGENGSIPWHEDGLPAGVSMEKTDEQQKDVRFVRDASEESRKNHKNIVRKIGACGIGAVLLLICLLLKYMGYIPWIRVETILIVFAGIMIAVMAGIILCERMLPCKTRKRERVYPESLANKKAGDGIANLDHPEENRTEAADDMSGAGLSVMQKREERQSKAKDEGYGETVVLCANSVSGPAVLVSREAGELATIYLQEEITVIGKLETAADAVIDLPTVSRIHAKIRKMGDDYYLTDLNSRNGTSVNGKILKSGEDYLLQEEDEVDFAQARFVFLK
ncbi:MAG: FHA domain-containing protein [Blautia sp.]|nr:FHA domain-containing protein [Blautia sp.]